MFKPNQVDTGINPQCTRGKSDYGLGDLSLDSVVKNGNLNCSLILEKAPIKAKLTSSSSSLTTSSPSISALKRQITDWLKTKVAAPPSTRTCSCSTHVNRGQGTWRVHPSSLYYLPFLLHASLTCHIDRLSFTNLSGCLFACSAA